MAKQNIDLSLLDDDPSLAFIWPIVIARHLSQSEPPLQFHNLFAGFGFGAGFGDPEFYVPIVNLDPTPPMIVTTSQQGLAKYMRDNANALCWACPWCNTRWTLPHHIAFERRRNPRHDYAIPAVYGDPDNYDLYLPDTPALSQIA